MPTNSADVSRAHRHCDDKELPVDILHMHLFCRSIEAIKRYMLKIRQIAMIIQHSLLLR